MFFETILMVDGRPQAVGEHEARMQRTAAAHGFQPPPLPDLARLVPADLASGRTRCRVDYAEQITAVRFSQGMPWPRIDLADGLDMAVMAKMGHRVFRGSELEDLADRYLDELSGGQRQRAHIAMVLAQDTDYVLLDEPLNNLDMQHSVHMMRHLHRAAAELGRTIIVVLHDINFAGHYADRICAVKDGRVVEFGPPEQIMTDEVLTRVFDTAVQVVDGPRGPLAVYY